MKSQKSKMTFLASAIGTIVVALIMVLGTIQNGRIAKEDSETAVSAVSTMYLSELAERREQVVSHSLQKKTEDMRTALELLKEEDLSSKEKLETYQTTMKRLFKLERFAFVDDEGLIYTSTGIQYDIDEYPFDYQSISEAEISILNPLSTDKKVIIAIPVDLKFLESHFQVCFMQIDMAEMLSGVSMQPHENGLTYTNLYTRSGFALSDTVLGGLAMEDNLLEAVKAAEIDSGYSYTRFAEEFEQGRSGIISFSYNGAHETLSYVPVEGTDWMLTYLIQEEFIGRLVGSVSDKILRRSIVQSLLTVCVLLCMFSVIITQIRKNAKLRTEKETADTENRVKQSELEQRLELQKKLLEEQQELEQQSKLVTALSSDYWSVYYIDLDRDEGVCYQSHSDLSDGFKKGEMFRFHEAMESYANRYITEAFRNDFLRFIQPDAIREGLLSNRVISYTYMVSRHGAESYEMMRIAAVRRPEDRVDGKIHSVGACFTDVDAQTRKSQEQQQILSDALSAAEQASKAKTAFLSSMSHEIRTPMNAIIGLDNIAINDPEATPKIRDYLQKINGSAEHLLQLINDILDMSRIESGRMTLKNEEFSFPKLLEAINTMFSTQCSDNGLDYQCHLEGQLDDYFIGDNMKLRQVLINILGNAVKFTPEGGRVLLNIKRIARYNGQSILQFVISDTGIGMSRDFLPHIFDTFTQEDSSTTSKYGSSGLGLAITKNIVEMMNGSIQVESEKGKGSRFTVTVALTDSNRKDQGDASEDIHPGDMTVLIVDDDPIACEHAKLVLEKAGIASETAQSGPEAIEMVRLRHARMEPYNLILVDWKMPEMDGVETTRRIREIVGHESAIIILTAYRWDDILEEATKAGVDSFVAKPLFATGVMEEYRSAVKRKGLAEKQQAHRTDLSGKRILLAEDVDVNAEIMLMLLEMRDIQTDWVKNGRLVLEKYTEHPAGYYDAILMDVRMPEMDGLEAARRIRATGREDSGTIPIIALTANAFDEDVQRSMQAGLNAHLTKPIQPELLFDTLAELIQ